MSDADEKRAEKPVSSEDIIKLLPRDLQDELTDAKPEERGDIIAAWALQSVYFEGPLPPSYMLREYEDILPGAADRIIGMAERQAEHRQSIEKTAISSKSRAEILGVVFAGLIGLGAIAGGVYLIATGQGTEGLVAIIAAMGGLVGTFIYGTNSEKKERAEKRRQRDDSSK